MTQIDSDRFMRQLQEYEAETKRSRELEGDVESLTREFNELCEKAKPYLEIKDALARVERRSQELEDEIDALNGRLEQNDAAGLTLDGEIESWQKRANDMQEEVAAAETDERQNGTLLKALRAERQDAEDSLQRRRSDLSELEAMIEKGRAEEKTWAGLCRDARVLLARWKTTNQMLEAGGHLVEQGHLAALVSEDDKETLKLLELMVANDNAFWQTEAKENRQRRGGRR